MALVVFLRGVNVGGHRTFRPSSVARELSAYDVVNVGAAGTIVVRKPGSRAQFRAALLRKLPFEAEVVLCEGRAFIRLEAENPFLAPVHSDLVAVHTDSAPVPTDFAPISFLTLFSFLKPSAKRYLPSVAQWFVPAGEVIAWTLPTRSARTAGAPSGPSRSWITPSTA
jgi:hypothetical protein